MYEDQLYRFVVESNRIEGITREPTDDEIDATRDFLELPAVIVPDLERFVSACARGASLRVHPGMDVRVGDHRPPPGGPMIAHELNKLLVSAQNKYASPYLIHCEYETLHPFMDGNGRSGRALWAWMMEKQEDQMLSLGFLHAFYYQTLSAQHEK